MSKIFFTDMNDTEIILCCHTLTWQPGDQMEFHEGTVVGQTLGGAVSIHFTEDSEARSTKEYLYLDRKTLEVMNDDQKKVGVAVLQNPPKVTLTEQELVALVFAVETLNQKGYRHTAGHIRNLIERLK